MEGEQQIQEELSIDNTQYRGKPLDNSTLKSLLEKSQQQNQTTLQLWNTKLTHVSIHIIISTPFHEKLHYLDLSSNTLSLQGIKEFVKGNWRKLQHLSVGDCGLKDQAVKKLVNVEWLQLEFLWLGKSLGNSAGNMISDDGFKWLVGGSGGLRSLQELWIQGNEVTPLALNLLFGSNLQRLKVLWIKKQVSQYQKERLKWKMPNVRIA